MDIYKLKEQVETIRQAFGYITRFKNQTFVIKIDSSLIQHPYFPALICDLVHLKKMGIKIIIVPGAKQRINEILKTFDINHETIDGIRISTAKAIPFIKMAAFDVCNKIMTLLAENDTGAIIGNWVRARSIGVRNGIDYHSTGIIDNLDTRVLEKVLNEDVVPIFPNIGWSINGEPYNISSNALAFTISKKMKVAKLFFITTNGGLKATDYEIPHDAVISEDGIISQMTIGVTRQFIDMNNKHKPNTNIECVSLGYSACKDGVKRVHIVDGRIEGVVLSEIFSNIGSGTMIYANQHNNIKVMKHKDIPSVLSIMEQAIYQNILINRTETDLAKRSDDYVVYEIDDTIHGCGALHIFNKKCAEIAGITVDKNYSKHNIGKKIISFLVDKAAKKSIEKLFVLTTQSSDWFKSIGFKDGDISELPKEKRESYNTIRNSRILVYNISKDKTNRFWVNE